ncbi:MAG: 2-phosphosulfolactate phosphatase, partial [Bacteroidota bacterium]
KRIAFTTTNGTLAIDRSKNASSLLIGAFLNIGSVATTCRQLNLPVLVVCAGWKGRFNLEDTLFAGALAEQLTGDFHAEDDSVLAAKQLWQAAKADLPAFLQRSSHVQRLNRLNIHEDFEFCLQQDRFDTVPRLEGDHLVA